MTTPHTQKYINNNSRANYSTSLLIIRLLSIALPLFSCIARPLLYSSVFDFLSNIKQKNSLAMIDYSSTESGEIIASCNKVSIKINCLNKKFSKVESRDCLIVNELVNLVSALMYLWILCIWKSTCWHYIL